MVAKQPEDRARLVAAAANRLRLIQIDFADESPEVRRGYLAEAIEGALADVLPQEHEAFLKELMERFPTWDPNVVVTAPKEEAGVQPSFDERELQDPSFLVSRLVEMAPQLSDEQKQGAMGRLREAGLAPQPQASLPEEPLKRVRRMLGLKPDAPLDAARLLGLLGSLADLVCALDQLVWRSWGRFAPASRFQSVAALRHVLSRYAGGDTAITDAQAEEDLLKFRHIVASFVSAVIRAPEIASTDVIASFIAPLAPERIQGLVKIEGGSIFVNEEVKCWRKYKELAAGLTEAAVKEEIRKKIQNVVDHLMAQTAAGRPNT